MPHSLKAGWLRDDVLLAAKRVRQLEGKEKMPVMTEEQFSHLEAMIIAMINSHIAVHKHTWHQYPEPAVLFATDLEHDVRKQTKEALTK